MRAPFPAYEGTEPYLFICYSHSDSDVVYPELVWLKESGLHIWYDEGISPGTVWREELAEALESAALLLFFASPASVRSSNCLREISFAADQDLSLLSVHLEPTTLPRGLRLAILDRQALLRYQLPTDEYQRKLLGAIRRIIERPAEVPKNNVGVRSRSTGEDRIHVGVGISSRRALDPLARDLAGAITQYLSWQGGIYRAHDLSSELQTPQQRIDYRIDVSAHADADTVQASWQVLHAEGGGIVWANRLNESSARFSLTYQRIAEMIGEGALKAIGDHELHRMEGHDSLELSYAQLVLRAQQPNYLDREQVVERLGGLKRAIELEPRAAPAHACLAQLLSWQIINGVSNDASRDETTLEEEAKLALKLSPNDPYVLLSVGTTYSRLRRYEIGLGLLRRARSLAPTVHAKDELARSLCFAGQPEEAVPLYQEILETMPAGHTFPYVRLAIPLVQMGRLSDALKYSRDGVIHFPEDYYSWVVHANLLAQLGDEDQAKQALEQARRLLPNQQLPLQMIIDGTTAMYGRTEEQRNWLTAGLRRLLEERREG